MGSLGYSCGVGYFVCFEDFEEVFVVCGDLVTDADTQSFADYNSIIADLNMPCYSVPGNHDVGNTPTLETLQFYRDNIGL